MITFTDYTMFIFMAEFTNKSNLHDHPWAHRNALDAHGPTVHTQSLLLQPGVLRVES